MHNLLDTLRYISSRAIWYIRMIGYYTARKQMNDGSMQYNIEWKEYVLYI